jgi:hypothetical protein
MSAQKNKKEDFCIKRIQKEENRGKTGKTADRSRQKEEK